MDHRTRFARQLITTMCSQLAWKLNNQSPIRALSCLIKQVCSRYAHTAKSPPQTRFFSYLHLSLNCEATETGRTKHWNRLQRGRLLSTIIVATLSQQVAFDEQLTERKCQRNRQQLSRTNFSCNIWWSSWLFPVVAVLDMTVSETSRLMSQSADSSTEMCVTCLLLSADQSLDVTKFFGNHDCGFRELA